MKWLALSIVASAAILSYAITMPYRECVKGYVASSTDVVSETTKALASMSCKMKG